LKKGKNKTES